PSLHAIRYAIRPRLDRRGSSLGKLLKLSLADLGDTSIGAHPEVAVAIFQNPEYGVVKQPILAPVFCEPSIFKPVEPAPVCANPQRPLQILVESPDDIVGKPVARSVGRELTIFVAIQTATVRTNPKCSLSIFGKAQDV